MDRIRNRWRVLVAGCLLLFTLSCMAEAPITGRRQLSLVSSASLNVAADKQYDDFLQQHKLSQNRVQTALVKRVGGRIQKAVEGYFRAKGEAGRLRGYDWQFNLVESEEMNAFCMPGGRVVIYTGILPVTQDEDGLAVVVGHEIAHAVANHHSERMSHLLLVQLGGAVLSQALKDKPERTRALLMTAVGAGASVGFVLPHSRQQEAEADELGLIFMAMAGYDPGAAVGLWQRMDKQGKGKRPPEFLSTHPAPKTRIRAIERMVPRIRRKYYKKPKAKPAPPKKGAVNI
jgi:predicted Zn-dependent protease